MSQITTALWETELPTIPKPDDLDYFDFITIVKRKQQQQKRGQPMVFMRALMELQKETENPDLLDLIQELIEWEIQHA